MLLEMFAVPRASNFILFFFSKALHHKVIHTGNNDPAQTLLTISTVPFPRPSAKATI